MAGKARTWVWVLVAVLVVGILIVIAGAAAGVYFFSRNIERRTVTATAAASEFDGVRGRFAGQRPLIELDESGNLRRTNTDRPPRTDTRGLDSLHILAFDPDDGGIVKMTIPFWLLRLKANDTTISLGSDALDLEDLKLTVEDLERFGPTLILDQRNAGGDRVLVWSQ